MPKMIVAHPSLTICHFRRHLILHLPPINSSSERLLITTYMSFIYYAKRDQE